MSSVTSKLNKAYCKPLVRRLTIFLTTIPKVVFLRKDLGRGGSEIHETKGESGWALTTSASQGVKPSGSPVVTPTAGAASILPHRAHLKSDFLTNTFINSRL